MYKPNVAGRHKRSFAVEEDIYRAGDRRDTVIC
jgi:hypothetical protein